MYAIVDIGGKQFKVEKNQEIFVPSLAGKEGDKVEFENVLLLDDDGKVQVGTPQVKGVKVSGKIISQVLADKVIVFKKKRRKGYKVKNGHRQPLTKVQVSGISK